MRAAAIEHTKVLETEVGSLDGLDELLQALFHGAPGAIEGLAGDVLKQDGETGLRNEMLIALYLANYPRAIYSGLSPESLEARSRAQIRVVLAGARKR